MNPALSALTQRRAEIERELLSISSELLRPGPNGEPAVGLKGNLVDKEGFPRADVDLMRITTLRNRMAILNTDLDETMRGIERELHMAHSIASLPPSSAPSSANSIPAPAPAGDAPGLSGSARRALLKPFAKVDQVFPGSPAAACGLKQGDGIVLFGHLDESTIAAKGFTSLATVVSPGATLKITIDPADGKGRKTVFLTPAPWSGQGLLGCKLVQIQAPTTL